MVDVPREDATTKGLRLLVEARLHVRMVDGQRVVAWCRGDSGEVYEVGYEPGGWYCNCPALGRSSHGSEQCH